MKKIVLVNEDFDDVYTGEHYKSGDNIVMTDERITEVKGVNPNLVTVIGAPEGEADAETEALNAKIAELEAELKDTQDKLKKAEAELKKAKSK